MSFHKLWKKLTGHINWYMGHEQIRWVITCLWLIVVMNRTLGPGVLQSPHNWKFFISQYHNLQTKSLTWCVEGDQGDYQHATSPTEIWATFNDRLQKAVKNCTECWQFNRKNLMSVSGRLQCLLPNLSLKHSRLSAILSCLKKSSNFVYKSNEQKADLWYLEVCINVL